jgi:hypothetical protein
MKEEALKLADELLRDNTQLTVESAYMIRRLVEELDKQKETIRNLNKTLGFVNSGYEVINLEPQTKPLSDEEILGITKDSTIFEYREFDDDMVRFARAIEERHGIK